MLREIDFKTSYDTYKSNPVTEFLVPCLERSATYDRAVAYFSAAVIACIPEVFSDFVDRGGKYRLICSPNLTAKDAKFLLGYSPEEALDSLNESIDTADSDSDLGPALDLFAKMLRNGDLELKFAIPKDNFGALFHQKIGVFGDKTSYVGFSGSNNESLSAWWPDHNSEKFHVFPSWTPGKQDVAQETKNDFEQLWSNNYPGFNIVDYKEGLAFVKRRENDSRNLSEIKKQVRKWYEKKKADSGSDSGGLVLRDYQTEVLKNWEKQGYRGLVSFATGAGKTITALKGIENWLELHPQGSAVILVPSKRLQIQWVEEVSKFDALSKLPYLLVGGEGKREQWINALGAFTQKHSDHGQMLVVAVMNSAATPDFWNKVKSHEDLVLVVDEMHNMGTNDRIQLLEKVQSGGILGLSATPKRFDDDQNRRLSELIGDELDPVIGIAEAQKMKVLVDYTYHPVALYLLPEEEKRYKSMSLEINSLSAQKKSQGSKFKQEKRLSDLRIQRAEITKNAANKPTAIADILKQNAPNSFSWLVFCNDGKQVAMTRKLIPDLNPMEFHQKMDGDQPETLADFSENGGVLLSIDMMNEGVDIASIQNTILGSSSQNPREFIQRLGRVLRRDPLRPKQPKVYDLIVLDHEGYAISRSEIKRARIIASTALNSSVELDIEGWNKYVDGEEHLDT